MADKTDIWVYAHWKGMLQPRCIGILSAQQAKGRKAFSFSYDKDWIAVGVYVIKENFPLFLLFLIVILSINR